MKSLLGRKPVQEPTFEYFNALPPELRMKIWKLALPRGRVSIQIYHSYQTLDSQEVDGSGVFEFDNSCLCIFRRVEMNHEFVDPSLVSTTLCDGCEGSSNQLM